MPRVNGGSPGSPIRSSSSGAIDHGPYSRSMGMSLIVENDALRSGARFSAGSSRSRSQSRRWSVMRPTLAPGVDRRLDLRVGQVVGDDDVDDIRCRGRPDDHGLDPVTGHRVQAIAGSPGDLGRRYAGDRGAVRALRARAVEVGDLVCRQARGLEDDERGRPFAAEVPRAAGETDLSESGLGEAAEAV